LWEKSCDFPHHATADHQFMNQITSVPNQRAPTRRATLARIWSAVLTQIKGR
jgi:hypothetical protein